jgi:hypothetical protein
MNSIPLSAIVFGLGVLATIGAAKAEEIAGAIDANGKPQIESTKYKVSHPGVGHYIITFTQAFPPPYATCIYMPIGNYHVSGLIEKTDSCDMTIVRNSGSPVNVLFNFLAVNTTN